MEGGVKGGWGRLTPPSPFQDGAHFTSRSRLLVFPSYPRTDASPISPPPKVTELISTLLSRPDGSGSNATSTAAAAAAAQALVGMRATLMRVLANASAPCGVV